jgi:transposase-like protein/IS1 family transposase
MNCPTCTGQTRKFGKNRNGSQRYRCDACKKTFTDDATRPDDARCVDPVKADLCLRMLLEGSSVRSVERLTGVNRETILNLLVEAGEACERFLDRACVNLNVEQVQADEIWSFVGCKERVREQTGNRAGTGDCYCFVALDKTSKMVIAWHIDRRTAAATKLFTDKLRHATNGRFQLSTDGYRPYKTAVWDSFQGQIDFAQLIKVYTHSERGGQTRYSPGEVVDSYPVICMGHPDEDEICTSHVERANLTMRMTLRRFTRLTNAHSKKWSNHRAALALYFAFYNFCRPHETLSKERKAKTTPAVAAGLADRVWSVGELLQVAA